MSTGSFGLNKNEKNYVFDFWNQKPLGRFQGDDVFSVELNAKESNVFAFHKVTNHPQIIGPSRHIVCGMIELHNIKWDHPKKLLSLEADLIEGKIMDIFVAVPKSYKVSNARASNSVVKITTINGNTVLSVTGEKMGNSKSDIKIEF